MQTRPLTPTPGVEITGVDLSAPLKARIGGLPASDSQALLAELLPHMTEPDLISKHRCSAGDVVMWDNSATMHRRDPFPGEFAQLIKRVSFRYPSEHRVPV